MLGHLQTGMYAPHGVRGELPCAHIQEGASRSFTVGGQTRAERRLNEPGVKWALH